MNIDSRSLPPSPDTVDGTSAYYSSKGHISDNADEWFEVDLGSIKYSLNQIRVTPRIVVYNEPRIHAKTWGFPADFQIEYSIDGMNFYSIPGAAYSNFPRPAARDVILPFDMPVNARYIRLHATKLSTDESGSNYILQIAGIKADPMYKASASSELDNPSQPAVNAIDGLSTTYYSSARHAQEDHTEWLQIELAHDLQGYAANRISFIPRMSGYGFPRNFEIQYSEDGVCWNQVPGASFTDYDASDGKQVVIPFNDVIYARYFRLHTVKLGTDESGQYSLQVAEALIETESEDDKAIVPVSATASSAGSGMGADLVCDNCRASYWSSVEHNTCLAVESFTLNYNTKNPVSRIVLAPRAGGLGFPVRFKLQYSKDGIAFIDIPGQDYTQADYPNPGSARQVFSFDPVVAKAIRVESTKLSTNENHAHCFQMAEAAAYMWDTRSDTWAATDDLGRTLPTYSINAAKREKKSIGMFYFLWLGQRTADVGPYNISEMIARNPDVVYDLNSPPWGDAAVNTHHHWNEPLFGYYIWSDRYMLRKHAQMLTDTGIDTVIFDVSNHSPRNPQNTFKDSYMALLEEWQSVRDMGGKTPQVVFLCPFPFDNNSLGTVRQLYQDLYGPGLYPDLWYMWEGKPVILANPEYFADEPVLSEFFTFRHNVPSYFTGPTGPNQWGWLEVYPQHAFYSDTDPVEMCTVGASQNASAISDEVWTFSQPVARGRSFHDGYEPEIPQDVHGYTHHIYGYNLQEQWGRAIEIDPKFVFVTGWNEWTGERWLSWNSGTREFTGNVFVDTFDTEFSRDIEPMKGGHGDNYYYLNAHYVRQYKGISKPQNADSPKTISIDGNFDDWKDTCQEFRDDIGDTAIRDNPGWGAAGPYINKTGRNDFVLMKVARDADNIYFYVRTKDDITSYKDPDWMMLFIKTTGTGPNWQGYNYVVNRTGITETTTTLEASQGGWDWKPVSSSIQYRVSGREMELSIPRACLGLEDLTHGLQFEFKWQDNMQVQGDINAFTMNGDSAPNCRFNYKYSAPGFGSVGSVTLICKDILSRG